MPFTQSMGLRFHQQWYDFHRQRLKKTGTLDNDIANGFKTIESTTLQNTVLNVSNGKRHPSSSFRRAWLGCDGGSAQLLPEQSLVTLANCTPKWSPFRHRCFKSRGFPGKILQFTRGGVIAAGKASPSDVFYRACSFLATVKAPYFQLLAYPNRVCSGEFRFALKSSLKTDSQVVCSSKFPGAAVILKDSSLQSTPEFYDGCGKKRSIRKKSKFILPGRLNIEELYNVLTECDRLAYKHSEIK